MLTLNLKSILSMTIKWKVRQIFIHICMFLCTVIWNFLSCSSLVWYKVENSMDLQYFLSCFNLVTWLLTIYNSLKIILKHLCRYDVASIYERNVISIFEYHLVISLKQQCIYIEIIIIAYTHKRMVISMFGHKAHYGRCTTQ